MITKKIFGFAIDAARQPESISTYKKTIDFLKDWGYNTILFRITDNQGTAIKFESHPELIHLPDAFSKKEISGLVEYAETMGIQIIPEIESFGHAGYITAVEEYRKLNDFKIGGTDDTFSLCPVNNTAFQIVADLYREVAELFNSKYIHGGCDEVIWGGCKLSQEALSKKTHPAIWAEYVNRLNQAANNLGKEFMIWGDHVLRKELGILDNINKDIIILDWEYSEKKDDKLLEINKPASEKGFRLIGCPALIWGKWLLRPGKEQLRNLEAFTEIYGESKNENSFGMILTNWCPLRFLSNSFFDFLAYASVSFFYDFEKARENAFKLFVEEHYGAEWDPSWRELFYLAYNIILPRWKSSHRLEGPFIQLPWVDETTLLEAVNGPDSSIPYFGNFFMLLDSQADKVKKNYCDYEAFALSFKYYRNTYERISSIKELKAKNSNIEEFMGTIKKIAAEDRCLLEKIDDAWDTTRNISSEMKKKEDPHCPGNQQIWPAMRKGAEFSAELAGNQALCEKLFIYILNPLEN